MFNVYVPDPIYERLPRIYLLLAAVLVVAPLSQIKWTAVAALLLAMMVTRHQRQIYRETSRLRGALNLKHNLAYDLGASVGEAHLTKTWKSAAPRGQAQPAHDALAETVCEKRKDIYRTVLIPNSLRGEGS